MTVPTILLIEDNPEDAVFLQRAFVKAGLTCEVRVAGDGQKGLDHLSSDSQRPSHVLLDLKLPRKSGIEILQWIRKHATLARIPVIVLTSSDVAADVDQARALGVDAYLVKPLSMAGLVDVVRSIANRWGIPSTGRRAAH
jgi:DNA-binding response OmpR family regulator